MTPVILSRQQLDQLWEIDRSEIIDTLYRLDNGQLRAYREYYDVRGWDPHDRQVYTPIHEACYDRGGIFFAFFDDEQMIAAAALDTLPRGMNGELRQLLFFLCRGGKARPGLGAATVSVCPAPAARNGGVRPLYLVDPQQKHRRFLSGSGMSLSG